MRMVLAAGVLFMGCAGSSTSDGGASPPAPGHFTFSVGDRVFRMEARVGASRQDVSAALERFGTGTRDRWLIASVDGAHLVLSTDRLACSLGECLAIAPADLSTLTLVTPGGMEVSLEGTPAVSTAGDAVIYPSQEGPHETDLWLTRKSGLGWGAATLLTAASSAAYNSMPALRFDGQRVLFDCGMQPYPESGGNDACQVNLDTSGFQVLARSTSLPNARFDFVQFPHDSVDGVLLQGSWPIGADSPETVWLFPASGAPVDIGRNFSNAVSPCGLRDGRFGLLWLARPENTAGLHELTLVARDGTLLGVLTPDVDVADIGIGCSD